MDEKEGHLVRALALAPQSEDDSGIYSLIGSGTWRGKELMVRYRGEPGFVQGNELLARAYLDDNKDVQASFISFDVPDSFDAMADKDVVLCGEWEPSWNKEGFRTPIFGRVAEFYDPGPMVSILYFQNLSGYIQSWGLASKFTNLYVHEDRRPYNPSTAARKYFRYMSREFDLAFPKVIVFDKGIDLDSLIGKEISDFNLHPIKIQSQK